MRADGRPSAAAVASAIASGTGTPAASASAYHRRNCASGSGSIECSIFTYPTLRPLSYPHSMAVTRTIELRTGIPGPRSQAILERKQRVVANAKTIALPVVAAEARGAAITDVDG